MFYQNVFSKRFIIRILSCVLFIIIFFHFPTLCQSHDSHGHSHEEPPSFKYSKQANINPTIDEKQDSSQNIPHSYIPTIQETPRDTFTLWVQALGSTLLISAAPFFILFLVPLDNSKEREPMLKILLSFASGSLLGDAFLHLIPHALVSHTHGPSEHSHSHSHSHAEEHAHDHDMRVGCWVLLGIITFLMVEKFVRLVKSGHGHSHGHQLKVEETKNSGNTSTSRTAEKTEGKRNNKLQKEESSTGAKSTHEVRGDIKVAGYLNLAADFTHNFTDGLAIGASYLAGKNIGIVTTITILLHEVPHEIGDFAILIQSGCSRKKAIFLQLSTAIGALTGTVISLLAEGIGDVATSWILPFTAGGFIYIATVSVIPELLADTKFWQSVKEIIALFVGVYMMLLIADYE